jgi:hypothetical protein
MSKAKSGSFLSKMEQLKQSLGLTSKTTKPQLETDISKSEDRQKMLKHSGLLGNLVASIAEQDPDRLRNLAFSYLEEKKQNYVGLGYLEQLEKNYLYLNYCVLGIVDHISMFLLGQEKAPSKNHVEMMLKRIRLATRPESSAHMKYLAFGCDGCDYHADHERYSKLRELRLKDMDAYIEEMEFGCCFYKASLTLSQACLSSLWDEGNKQVPAGSVKWDREKTNKMLALYINHTVSCVLDDLPLRDKDGVLLKYIVLD